MSWDKFSYIKYLPDKTPDKYEHISSVQSTSEVVRRLACRVSCVTIC